MCKNLSRIEQFHIDSFQSNVLELIAFLSTNFENKNDKEKIKSLTSHFECVKNIQHYLALIEKIDYQKRNDIINQLNLNTINNNTKDNTAIKDLLTKLM